MSALINSNKNAESMIIDTLQTERLYNKHRPNLNIRYPEPLET